MKLRLLPLALIAALLLAFGTIAMACGDGGLSLEEYFDRMAAANEQIDQQLEALENPTDREFASDEEELAAIQGFYNAVPPLIRDFISDLEEIDPPAEVEDAHKEVVEAARVSAEEWKVQADQLNEAESLRDLMAKLFVENPAFTASGERFDEACLAVQAIADENNIDVDLDCDDAT